MRSQFQDLMARIVSLLSYCRIIEIDFVYLPSAHGHGTNQNSCNKTHRRTKRKPKTRSTSIHLEDAHGAQRFRDYLAQNIKYSRISKKNYQTQQDNERTDKRESQF